MKIKDCVITIKEDRDGYFDPPKGPIENQKGRIIFINQHHEPRTILVEFFNFINGHNGLGAAISGRNGHCWWMSRNNLTIIERYKFNYND